MPAGRPRIQAGAHSVHLILDDADYRKLQQCAGGNYGEIARLLRKALRQIFTDREKEQTDRIHRLIDMSKEVNKE